MKYIKALNLILLIALAVNLQSCVQSAMANTEEGLNQFFETYENKESDASLDLGGFALNIALGKKDRKFQSLRMLSFSEENMPANKDLEKLKRSLKKGNMESLAQIKDAEETINFYGIEEEGFFKEIVMTLESKEVFLIAQVKGKFTGEALKDLSMDIDGFEHLDEIQ